MADRFTLRSAVHLLLLKDGEVLLLRRFNTGWQDGNYGVVAGHLDGNETVRAAMVREAKEEADITIRPEDLRVVHVMHRDSGDFEYIDFFLTTDIWEGEVKIGEPDKCDELAWFPLDAVPSNMVPYVQTAIEYHRNGVMFSEYGWDGAKP